MLNYNLQLSKLLLNKNYINLINVTRPVANVAELKRTLKSYDEIPGPKEYPIFGSMLNFKAFGGQYDYAQVREFQSVLQANYGDIVRWSLFNDKSVYLFNPEHIKMVFKSDSLAPMRPPIEPLIKLHKKIGISATLLNSQQDRWRKLRSASNPILARPQTIHSYIGNQNEVANEFIHVINQKFSEANTNDKFTYKSFDQLLRLLALEYVSEIVFNQRLKCVNEKTRIANVSDLVSKIDSFFVLIGKLSFDLPLWKIFPTKQWREFEVIGTFVYDVVRSYIKEAQEKLESSPSETKKTILGQYLERKDKYGLNINDITAIMTDLLIAGVDTTSTAIYFLLYELGVNQDVQQRLYEEIQSVLKNDTNVTDEHVEKLKYLKNVVKESLRIHNNAPANARRLTDDLVLEDYLIPKGTLMVLSTTYITKSERFFKNPNKFDPTRWDRDEKGIDTIDPYANLPFGFGVRMCIGRRVAEQEIYLTLIKILQNYRVEYNGEAPGIKIGLILSPDRPLDITFAKRNA